MAKNKIDWLPGQTIKRDSTGRVIATRTAAQAGSASGSGKNSPLKEFKAVVKGFSDPKDISKETQKALAKIDLSEIKYKDLAKFGLDKSLSKEQFKEFKGLFKDAQANNAAVKKVSQKEIKELAKFAGGAKVDAKIGDLQTEVDELIPGVEESVIDTPVGPAGTVSPERGRLANLDLSIFARRAVSRARGVRGAVRTGMGGASNYGASLARISLGAM